MTFQFGQDISKHKYRCVYCKKIIKYAHQLAYDLSNPERKGHYTCGLRSTLMKDYEKAFSDISLNEASDSDWNIDGNQLCKFINNLYHHHRKCRNIQDISIEQRKYHEGCINVCNWVMREFSLQTLYDEASDE